MADPAGADAARAAHTGAPSVGLSVAAPTPIRTNGCCRRSPHSRPIDGSRCDDADVRVSQNVWPPGWNHHPRGAVTRVIFRGLDWSHRSMSGGTFRGCWR